MLYDDNKKQEKLSDDLFKSPGSEYRATPFWAWNCKLEREELLRQIDIFREMGLGGFHMHVRTGLESEYLSDGFMGLVEDCVKHAKENGMLAWLYDEDRYPSGAAGGIVTKNRSYREKYITFTCDSEYVPNAEDSVLLARFDIQLDAKGALSYYKKLSDGECAQGRVWSVWREISADSRWYNNQSYLDTLNPDAVKKFIEVTHERYKECVGREFGKTVPAIFTDEPQFLRKQRLHTALGTDNVSLPWTDSFPTLFEGKYRYSIIDKLPELIWDLPNGEVSVARYNYHDYLTELFVCSFADICGKWCDENNIALTGHMMDEPTLWSQSAAVGEAMRSYRSFSIPGIDMLCAFFEFTTAKQAQSAVHQYGRAGMMSELYGVTGWDFDFRGHKMHGDWQAALGVTVRVPHLSWVSMKGNAKRDYPASISYQSSWYKEYSYVEDHFARVNTALTRGKPMVHIGMIHPIESLWLHCGPVRENQLAISTMENNFKSVTDWLLRGSIDFDYISEALLPELCQNGAYPLRVGEMEYDVIIVPECETLRSSTLDRLEAFERAGGKLIFMGEAPRYENALPSERGADLYKRSEKIAFRRSDLLYALEDCRDLEIRGWADRYSENLIHQLRRDCTGVWLFIANVAQPESIDVIQFGNYSITLKGRYVPKLYDTLTGEIHPMDYIIDGGKTTVKAKIHTHESLLIFFEDAKESSAERFTQEHDTRVRVDLPLIPAKARYTLSEPNVYLLDVARGALDGGELGEREEILKLDEQLRKSIGLDDRRAFVCQPWAIGDVPAEHKISLLFEFESDIDVDNAMLALEDADVAEIEVNGAVLHEKKDVGYFTDRAIRAIALPPIKKGNNTVKITLPFGARTDVENCFILGDFGVEVCGRERRIVAARDEIAFDDITRQGLAHYGGAVTYHIDLDVPEAGELYLSVPHYRAAVLTACVDGTDKNTLAYPPYTVSLGEVEAGAHRVDITAYISRVNCFGALHHADRGYKWKGPNYWFSKWSSWTYEYRLCEEGIISTPKFYIKK